MNRILHLIRLDLRQVTRDSMLAMALFAPFLLILVVRYGVPFISELLYRELSFDLSIYNDLILSFVLILIPLMLGMLTGFMMLDERDENLIQYYAITPLTKMGYFIYRLALPVVLSILYNVLLLAFGQLDSPSLSVTLPVLLMLAIEAPIITFVLAGFANNKVEGLALSKGLGLVIFIPAVAYFIPFPWQLLAGFVPTYWAAQTLLVGMKGEIWISILYAVVGLVVHGLVLWVLARRYSRRAD
jgi:fluoroquinolone transport system permease protein